MVWSVDARVPVRLGSLGEAGEGDALLMEGDAGPGASEGFEVAAHAAGCACCVTRSGAAEALGRLFQRRAKGEVAFFRRVLAVTSSPEGDLAVWTALRADPVVAARFRLDGD